MTAEGVKINTEFFKTNKHPLMVMQSDCNGETKNRGESDKKTL